VKKSVKNIAEEFGLEGLPHMMIVSNRLENWGKLALENGIENPDAPQLRSLKLAVL